MCNIHENNMRLSLIMKTFLWEVFGHHKTIVRTRGKAYLVLIDGKLDGFFLCLTFAWMEVNWNKCFLNYLLTLFPSLTFLISLHLPSIFPTEMTSLNLCVYKYVVMEPYLLRIVKVRKRKIKLTLKSGSYKSFHYCSTVLT